MKMTDAKAMTITHESAHIAKKLLEINSDINLLLAELIVNGGPDEYEEYEYNESQLERIGILEEIGQMIEKLENFENY